MASGERRVQTLDARQALAVLDERSKELLGVSAEKAMLMAENGELEDDLVGSIVTSWVMMAKGAQAEV